MKRANPFTDLRLLCHHPLLRKRGSICLMNPG
jgi:hypothetical protein